MAQLGKFIVINVDLRLVRPLFLGDTTTNEKKKIMY